LQNFVSNLFKGILIGIAFVIPGLSGGTIALILMVYEKLITELAKINFSLIKKIILLDFKNLNKKLSFSFLIPIGLGGIIGVVLFAKILENLDLLGEFKPYTLSYFFGLVLASVIYIINMVSCWKKIHTILFLIGLTFAIYIAYLPYFEDGNNNLLYIFFCGFIGVFGMIIPGLSGSHLLWILGNYTLIVKDSVNNFLHDTEYTVYLLVFFSGIIFGIVSLSKIIKWIFQKHRNKTLATIAGFVFGSLIFLWPITNNSELSIIQNIEMPDFNIKSLKYLLFIFLGFLTIDFFNVYNKKI